MMNETKTQNSLAILTIDNASVYYGGIRALAGVSLEVNKTEVVTVLGANGAGKSSLLRAICGLAKLSEGSVSLEGVRIDGLRTAAIAKRGIVMQAEGHPTFPRLTVRENLELAYSALPKGDKSGPQELEKVLTMFPRLRERLTQHAGTLSGGEQQMLSIARGLISKPKVMLMDEPSLGLAPVIVDQIFEIINQIKTLGMSILIVEQNANIALQNADRGYVMEKGRVVIQGAAKDLLNDDRVRKIYLGEV
jgi:branched-chain amino acid transport system ATP-binding protein